MITTQAQVNRLAAIASMVANNRPYKLCCMEEGMTIETVAKHIGVHFSLMVASTGWHITYK